MASSITYSIFSFHLILFSTFFVTINGGFSEQVSEIIGMKRMEKESHLHFFFHDIHSGQNPTAMKIIDGPANYAATMFGTAMVMDNPLTEEPEARSKLVGRAQGMYMSASQQEIGFLMVMNLAFTVGKYNGSVITILGRNPVFNQVREMPIVGGAGLFRFARGYALVKTHWLDSKTGDAVVEYDVFVMHY